MSKFIIDENVDVLDAALERFRFMFENGEVVISFSGGKDSGICVDLALLAKDQFGIDKPVYVVMRDEEVLFPGTHEFALRTAQRDGVEFTWAIANQPVINIFNREKPYFWVYDPLLDPSEWVAQPPSIAQYIPDKNIDRLVTHERLGFDKDTMIYNVIGLRTQESNRRKMAIISGKGYLTKPKDGKINAKPVWDWKDGDVWKFISDFQCDYNTAYDVMYKHGLPRNKLRIAPATLSESAAEQLVIACKAYPKWFDKVCKRLPGVKLAVNYGDRAIKPQRLLGESWSECYQRTCINEAPKWIALRSEKFRDIALREWSNDTTDPFPEKSSGVKMMSWRWNSWERLVKTMYNGDPFCIKQDRLPYMEPEFFRQGAGTWGGRPSF